MEYTASDFHKLASPAWSLDDRRIHAELEIRQELLLPPVQSHPTLPFKANPGPGNNRDDHAALAHIVVVPDPAGVGGGFTPNVLPGTGSVDIPVGGIPSTDSQPLNTACRLEAIGSCLDSRGFPPEVIELLLSATRKNTNAAYQSAWKNWNNWCHARNVHPMSGGVKEVFCYLAGIFGASMSYSSINVSRSMLSSNLNMGIGNREEIGKHPLVTRLMKGIFQARPPTPKYSGTWDPSIVLSHFVATAGQTLSLLQLARKLATLLALTILLRCAEIASIQRETFEFAGLKVYFDLGTLRKSQRSGPLLRLSLDEWSQNKAICPLTCLRSYIERTSIIRTPQNAKQLLIGSTKPHNPVTSATVGRWIKDQLREAGIDTSIFSAHSTRWAAASKATSSGVSIQAILKQGHWSNESSTVVNRLLNRTQSSQPF